MILRHSRRNNKISAIPRAIGLEDKEKETKNRRRAIFYGHNTRVLAYRKDYTLQSDSELFEDNAQLSFFVSVP